MASDVGGSTVRSVAGVTGETAEEIFGPKYSTPVVPCSVAFKMPHMLQSLVRGELVF